LVSRHKLPETFFVIQGEEISSSDGHIIGLFLDQEIPAGMTAYQTIRAIHAQGGIAIAAHPLLPHSVGKLANTLPFDAIETMNAAEKLHYALVGGQAQKHRSAFYEAVVKPRMGASDAHDPDSVAECYTLVNCDPTPEAVRAAILSGQTTPVASISDEDERSMMRHGLPHILALYERATNLSPLVKRLMHTENVSFTLSPKPVFSWTKKF
jgi:predicted metal-dependent phosphoesterase TrpH